MVQLYPRKERTMKREYMTQSEALDKSTELFLSLVEEVGLEQATVVAVMASDLSARVAAARWRPEVSARIVERAQGFMSSSDASSDRVFGAILQRFPTEDSLPA
jgi:hypothetical protein